MEENNNNIIKNPNSEKNNNESMPSRSLIGINILNRVFHVLSIIGIVLAMITIASSLSFCIYLLASKDNLVGPDSIPLWEKILIDTSRGGYKGISIYTLALLLLDAVIYNIGLLILSLMAKKYFKNNIIDGTPFTTRGQKGAFRLGFYNIVIGLAVMIVCTICYAIFYNVFKNDIRGNVAFVAMGWSGLTTGLVYMVISMFIGAANDQIKNKTN